MTSFGIVVFAIVAAATAKISASGHAPLVTFTVTTPDKQSRDLTASESGVASMTYDGVEYEFRPTIQDSSPWNHVVITIFKAATAQATTQVLGAVDLKTGGPRVESKTKPAFQVAVVKVSPPPAGTSGAGQGASTR
jgi:hypothetical protein